VIPERRGYLFDQLAINNWIGTCSTVLVRRSAFEKVGLFDEALASGVDYDMWLRISREFTIEYIRECLVDYTVHGKSISTDLGTQIRGIEGQLKKYSRVFACDQKSYSRRYLSLGVFYCYNGDVSKGRTAFVRAIRADPLELRTYFNFLLSFSGPANFTRFKRFKDRVLRRSGSEGAV
jgi:hypothetical protein